MRSTTTPTSILKNTNSFVYAKVIIDGNDLTSRLIGPIEISSDIDSKGWQCTLTFNNDPSLPDLLPGSGSIFTNTLKPRKVVRVELKGTLTKGDRAGTYDLVFDGLTGDDVESSRSENKNDTVTVRCRGRRQKLLADTFILDERIYPVNARGAQVWLVGNPNTSDTAANVAQQILNDYVTGVTIYGTGPSYNIFPYRVREIDVWQAVQNVFLPTGWEVRERWYSGTGRFELVIADPLVVGGSDTLTLYKSTSLNYSDADIRNKIRIYWRSRNVAADKSAGALEPPEGYDGVLYLERSDAASIATYGERSILIREEKTSGIDTYAEAYALAGYILADLKDPLPPDVVVHKGALYHIEPYDAITLSGRQSGTLMVTAVQFTIHTGGYAETVIRGVRKTVRATDRWIELDSRTGDTSGASSDSYTGSDSEMPPAQVTGLTLTARFESVLAKWNDVTTYSNGKPIEAKARYKIYIKRSLTAGIPAIDIGNATTYDEIVYVDHNEAILKVNQALEATTTPQYIACVVTAVSRNGREGVASSQAEARSIANFGIGVESAEANARIHGRDNDGVTPIFLSESVLTAANVNPMLFVKARGTYAAPTAVLNGDELAVIRFQGQDTVGNSRVGAKLVVSVAGTVGNNLLPTRLGIYTREDTETFDTEKFAIESSGHVNIKPRGSAHGGGLEIWPWGTSAGNTGQFRLRELAANGTSVVGFKAPDSLAFSVIWTLPAADGSGGQVLTTNGAGVLSWTTPAGGIGGSGTAGFLPKWATANTLTNSLVQETSNGIEFYPIGTAAGNTGRIYLRELAANGTQAVGFKAPDSIVVSLLWTLPSTDGTNGQVLTTNGAGVLSWTTPTGGIGGSGTVGFIPKFTASATLGNSVVRESGGLIGIGITPTSVLHIYDASPTFAIQASGANQDVLIKFKNSADSDLAAIFCDDNATAGSKYLRIQSGLSEGIALESTLAHPIIFRTNATERMRILSTGQVGIGVTSPAAFLHIAAATTSLASLRIPGGSTPSSPGDGDIWYDTELYFRKSTASIGLLGWNKAAGNTVLLTTSTDLVGIGGVPASGVKVHIYHTSSGEALRGEHTATTGVNYGLRGSTASTSAGAAGVIGIAGAASGTIYGVQGVANNSTAGRGVYGRATSGRGVYGETATGYGVFGIATGAGGFAGVFDGECAFSNGIVRLNGGMSWAVTSIASNYTVVSTDIVVLVSAAGGARTITLPSAAARIGRILWIIKSDTSTNSVTVSRAGTDQIGIAPALVNTVSTTTPFRGWLFVSGGSTTWYAGAIT